MTLGAHIFIKVLDCSQWEKLRSIKSDFLKKY